MKRRLRLGSWGLLAAAGSVAMAWAYAWKISVNDYADEAAPAFSALLHGHFQRFLDLAPAYGGSLELRAPFALITSLRGAGELAIYRASALPCLLAAAGLGLWLIGRMRRQDVGIVARCCALGVCVVNPITYQALKYGHPEEVLGAALCVAAVLCAMSDRPIGAGLLLGLAIGNKEWALLAAGPVLVALPSGRRKSAAIAGAAAALLIVPIVLAAPGGLAGGAGRLATSTGDTFHPFQVWWFLGNRVHWIPAMAATIPKGARLTPAWLDGRAHLIIVGISVPLTVLFHQRRGRATRSPLLLLALLLLLRCVLDPWDAAYYPLPFVLALLAWETVGGLRRAPLRAVGATIATGIAFVVLPRYVNVDVQATACLVVAFPAAVVLARAVYGPLLPQSSTTGHHGPGLLGLRARLPVFR